MRIGKSNLFSLLLVFVFFVGIICPCIAFADDIPIVCQQNNTSISMSFSDILALSGTEGITDAEMSYFTENGPVLQYPAPSGNACAVNVGKNGFTVCASAEEYIYADGKTICFLPVSARLGDVSHDFILTDGLYTASFGGLDESTSYDVELVYSASVVIEEEQSLNLISLPYIAGKEASDAVASYNDSFEEYNGKLAEYENICALHAAEIEAYDAYLQKLNEYEAAVMDRDAYKKAVKEYDDVIASYASYAAGLEEYKKTASEYASHLAGREIALSKLCVIESLFVKLRKSDSDDTATVSSIYDRIMSNTVTEVLANKKELIMAGADEKDINAAGKSTESLRKYIGEYKNAKTDEEKFASYKKNYILIKTNFTKLYESLTSLYENKLVRAALNDRNKTASYEQFLGQLSMICSGFENKEASSPTSVTWDASAAYVISNDDGMPEKSDYIKNDIHSGLVVPVYKIDFTPKLPDYVAPPDIPDKTVFVGESPMIPVFSETVNELRFLVESGTLCEKTEADVICFDIDYSVFRTFSTFDFERGDMNADGILNASDAIYLLRHILRSSNYPISQEPDMNHDDKSEAADAIYLLRHTLRPSKYPLY